MAWMASVALKTQAEYTRESVGLPSSLNFDNFRTILGDDDLQRFFVNSLLVVGIAVPLVTITSVAAGYALARLWGRAGLAILMVFLLSELVPITILVIPLLLTVRQLGIDHSILRLVLVYTVAAMGFGVLVSRSFFRSIPEELREAARLDGCSELGVFRRVMVPLARSPISMIAVIAFIFFWNEVFIAVILVSDAADRTIPLGLTQFKGQYSTNWPAIAAALILSAIPTTVLYIIFQKRIAGQFSRSTTNE